MHSAYILLRVNELQRAVIRMYEELFLYQVMFPLVTSSKNDIEFMFIGGPFAASFKNIFVEKFDWANFLLQNGANTSD